MAQRNIGVALLLAICILPIVLSRDGHDHGHHHHHHDHHGHDHHGHDHHHHHHHHDHPIEPPSFKYSRQANQPAAAAPKQPEAKHDHHHHGHHDHHHDHHHHHHHHAHHPTAKAAGKKETATPASPSKSSIWLYALGSTLGISLAPFVILFFIHIDMDSPCLRVLLAFASGGLLGDAFLHLIPHSVPHSHGHSHEHGHGHDHHHHHEEEEDDHFAHTMVGVWVIAGIIGFLIVEKILRHWQGGSGHSHGHEHHHGHGDKRTEGTPIPPTEKEKLKRHHSHNDEHDHGEDVKKDDAGEDDFEVLEERRKTDSSAGDSAAVRSRKKVEKAKDKEDDNESDETKAKKKKNETEVVASAAVEGDIKVGGYLNLVADIAHNFTDGLAIGATYMAGQNIGLWTSFIILCHEIPHEIGDFALLVQSGCPRYKAIFLQLFTALGAFAGCLLSLWLGASEVQGKTSWVIPFTAGGFIYIGTVTIIPELLSGVNSLKRSVVELLAMLTGIGMMFFIAIYEEHSH